MTSRSIRFIVATIALFCSQACFAAEADHAGIVKLVAGDVVIIRNNSPLKASVNMRLMKSDILTTGADGKVGVIMGDDTTISMGPNSRIAIENYMFQPSEKKLSLIARMFQGTASFISGQIGKLAPEQMRVETPSATIGTRGTAFLVMVPPE